MTHDDAQEDFEGQIEFRSWLNSKVMDDIVKKKVCSIRPVLAEILTDGWVFNRELAARKLLNPDMTLYAYILGLGTSDIMQIEYALTTTGTDRAIITVNHAATYILQLLELEKYHILLSEDETMGNTIALFFIEVTRIMDEAMRVHLGKLPLDDCQFTLFPNGL